MKVILILLGLCISCSSHADKKVQYRTKDGKIQCLGSRTYQSGKVTMSTSEWKRCSIPQYDALISANIYKGEGTLWYDIKPVPKPNCGLKYNPKTGKHIYVKCFD